ncbi:type 1 fimbrial protein, partial [Escherichia coli]|uniref:type 1 fimbrial protein n=1 Tax=Escherichia coli TaxID=562 RepID=UPI001124F672
MKNNRAWALISGLILFSGTAPAADNLHFTGNLLGKSCTPVILSFIHISEPTRPPHTLY